MSELDPVSTDLATDKWHIIYRMYKAMIAVDIHILAIQISIRVKDIYHCTGNQGRNMFLSFKVRLFVGPRQFDQFT